MKKILFFLCCFFMCCTMYLQAQYPAVHYAFSESKGSYEPVSGSDVFLFYWNAGSSSEGRSINYKLPFQFNYAGKLYDSVVISPNGWIAFFNGLPTSQNPTTPAIDQSPTNLLAPFWSYLIVQRPKSTDLQTSVTTRVIEKEGEQIWVLQYENVWWNSTVLNSGSYRDTLLNFQIRLYHNTGIIEFVYGKMGTPSNAIRPACIGINTRYSNDITQFISVTPGVAGALISKTIADNSIQSNEGLEIGTTYRFTPPTTCIPPGYPEISEITAYSVRASWHGGSSNSYRVIYTKITDTNWTDAKAISANGTSTYIQNMQANTAYKVKVENVDCAEQPSAITEFATGTDIPWFESFEYISRNFPIPPEMKVTGLMANKKFIPYAPAPNTMNRIPKSGSGMASFYTNADSGALSANYKGVNNWLFTPKFHLKADFNYRFSFWYITDGIKGWEKIEVKAGATQDSLQMTMNMGEPILNPMNKNYRQYYYDFKVDSDMELYIGIHCVSDKNPFYFTIDDLSLDEMDAHCKADLHYVDVTESTPESFTIVWDSTAPNYQVQYKLKNSSNDWLSEPTFTTNKARIEIQDLTPNAIYSVRVRAMCSSESYSNWFETEASTTVDFIEFPYLQQFDDSVANIFKSWSKYVDYTIRASVDISSSQSASSPNSIGLYNGNRGGYNMILISPPINGYDEMMQNLQTRFKARSGSGSLKLSVGIMTNPADIKTFIPVDTVSVTNSFALHKTQFKTFDRNIQSKVFHIAYCFTSTVGSTDNQWVYIDDIYIERIPQCDSTPQSPTVLGATPESIVFNVPYRQDEPFYEYSYRKRGVESWSNTISDFETFLNVTNLDLNTEYELRVRYYCNGGSTYTAWSFPTRGNTTCPAPAIPWKEDFKSLTYNEEKPKCMNFSNFGNNIGGTHSSVSNIWDDRVKRIGYNDDKYLYFGNFCNTWMFSPSFFLKADSSYRFSFWYLSDGLDGRDSLEVKVGKFQTAASMTISFDKVILGFKDTVYQQFYVDFIPTQSDYYSFGIHHVYRLTKSQFLCIDELELKPSPTCMEPTVRLNGGMSSSTEIPLAFKADTIRNFRLDYWLNDVQQPRILVDDTVYTLTGLLPDTTYIIKAKTACAGGGQSEYSPEFYVKTLGLPITAFPWKENFGSIAKAGELPKGMAASNFRSNINTDVTSLGSVRDSYRPDISYKEYNYAYFAAAANDWLITPGFALEKNKTYRFSFWYRGFNSVWDSLEIGVGNMQAPEGMTIKLGNPLTKFNVPTYRKFFADFKPDKDSVYFFGIHCVGGNAATYYVSVDELGLELSPDCPGLCNIGLTSIDSRSATITLNTLGSDFEIRYAEVGNISHWETRTVTSGSYEFNDLKASSKYVVTAREVCGSDSFSKWSDTLTIATDCLPLTLSEIPFYQDFDSGIETPALPHCWAGYVNCGQGSSVGTFTGTNNAYSTPNSLRLQMNNICFESNYPLLASPEINRSLDFRKLRTTFYARTISGEAYLKIGYITNPSSPQDFYLMDSLKINSSWDYHTISSARYIGEIPNGVPVYIAYKLVTNNTQILIDNILIDSLASCADIFNLKETYATDKSISVAWTADASTFEIGYKKTIENETAWQYTQTSGAMGTVTGLVANTSYDIKVRTICSSNIYGRWSNTRKISTNFAYLDTLVLPLYENFDTIKNPSLPLSWRKIGEVSTLSKSAGAKINSDTNSVFLNNQQHTQTVLISPPIDINSISKIRTRFMVCVGGNYKLRIGLMKNPTDISTFVLVEELSLTVGWHQVKIPFDNFAGFAGGSDVAYIAYMHGDTMSLYDTKSIYLDDIYIERIPTCQDVGNLAVTNITGSAIGITWDADGGTDFRVRYKKANDNFFTDSLRVTGNNFIITGLQNSTNYLISLKRICSEKDQGLYSTNVNATTLCGTQLPYSVSFDTNITCWIMKEGLLGASTTTLVDKTNWMHKPYLNVPRNPQAMIATIEGTNCYKWLISPEINAVGIDTVTIEFDFGLTLANTEDEPNKTGADDRFTVLISSDLNFTTDSAVRTYDNQGSAYVFNNISPIGQHARILIPNCNRRFYMAFYVESTVQNARNDLSISNLKIAKAITCPTVDYIDTIAVASHEATLSWSSMGAGKWQLSYGQKDSIAKTVIVYDDPAYTLTGLTPAKEYIVAVRTICNAEDTANWSNNFSFTTKRFSLCPIVTNISVINIAYTSATAMWTKGVSSQWEVEYGKRNETTDFAYITVSGQSQTELTNLSIDTEYKLRVRSICMVTDTSDWSEYYFFKTQKLPLCDTVHNLRCVSIEKQNDDKLKANIAWNQQDRVKWLVEYGEKGFILGNGTQDTAFANNYTIGNLTENQAYDVYITTICQYQVSIPSLPLSFEAKLSSVENNLIRDKQIIIAPNPARDYVDITLKQLQGEVGLQIFNTKGEQVYSEEIKVSEETLKHRISLQSLSKGIYTIKFTYKNQYRMEKLIVQ